MKGPLSNVLILPLLVICDTSEPRNDRNAILDSIHLSQNSESRNEKDANLGNINLSHNFEPRNERDAILGNINLSHNYEPRNERNANLGNIHLSHNYEPRNEKDANHGNINLSHNFEPRNEREAILGNINLSHNYEPRNERNANLGNIHLSHNSEPRNERDANLGNIHLSHNSVHHPLPTQPHQAHHPLPTQPSGYPYHPSQPSYPDIIGPAYHPPPPHHAEPIYGHHPSHNCTVEDEVLQAEICTPTYTSSCGPFKVKGTKLGEKEKCFSVSRTVCTQAQETQTVEVCLIEYQDKKQAVTATTVEVKFAKACEKQMVTVCQPQPAYGSQSTPYSYHTVQHCKEVGQETCYNVPRLDSKQIQVEITLPEPVEKCQTRSVIVPTVECEDVTDKKCIKLPSVEETDSEAQACVPVVDKPKCDKVELVLPKQICRELLYGYAEKPVHKYEHPKPPFLSHAGKIKYGPKVTKKRSSQSSSTQKTAEPEEKEIANIPESFTMEYPS